MYYCHEEVRVKGATLLYTHANNFILLAVLSGQTEASKLTAADFLQPGLQSVNDGLLDMLTSVRRCWWWAERSTLRFLDITRLQYLYPQLTFWRE